MIAFHFRYVKYILLLVTVAVLFAYFGCAKHYSEPQIQAKNTSSYFVLMEKAHELEHAHRYTEAIAVYRKALTKVEDVDQELRNAARVAVHNRLGASYRALGKREEAIGEFKTSLALGDQKYAPKALGKLQKDQKPQ